MEQVAQRGEIFILEEIKKSDWESRSCRCYHCFEEWVAMDSLQRCSLASNILWLCHCGEPRKWQFCHVHNAESSVFMLRKVLIWSHPLASKGGEWPRMDKRRELEEQLLCFWNAKVIIVCSDFGCLFSRGLCGQSIFKSWPYGSARDDLYHDPHFPNLLTLFPLGALKG